MDDARISQILSDRWISFPRSEAVLRLLHDLMLTPRQTRMPGVLIHGASGIGKTMIARKLCRDFRPTFDAAQGKSHTPLLLLQAPPAPDERRFYLHILDAVGAPTVGARTIADLELRTLRMIRALDLKMLVIDEVHNLLSGSHREQTRFLNVLRYLSNDLEIALVCFGVSEAVEALRGDTQLHRRLDDYHLPNWTDDAEFTELIRTLIAAMPLEKASSLSVKSLRQILSVGDGVTAIIFKMIRELAIQAINSGEERITDEAVAAWKPRSLSALGLSASAA